MMNDMEVHYKSMLEGLNVKIPEKFFFSPTFNHFQKVNNRIYVYVTPEMFNRWKVQAYITGTTGICSLEARINWEASGERHQLSHEELLIRYGRNIQKLFELGEEWLTKYGDNPDAMEKDDFHPFVANGWKGYDITLV